MKRMVKNSAILLFVLIMNSCNKQDSKALEKTEAIKLPSISSYVTFEDYDVSFRDNKSLDGFRDFQSYKESFDTLIIDKTVYYIVEGDLLLDIDELTAQFERKNKPDENGKLVGLLIDGDTLRIENPTNIRYSVIKATFTDKEYGEVLDYMNKAAASWRNVCNVNFVHISNLDSVLRATDNPDEVTFVVRKIGYTSDGLLASAFFPYDPKSKRKILITPSFFTTSFRKPGILTHEMGHILGFRHEHIRSGAPAECPRESTNSTINYGNYDPQSVMHYFCGGAGSRDLNITKVDSIGASLIYK